MSSKILQKMPDSAIIAVIAPQSAVKHHRKWKRDKIQKIIWLKMFTQIIIQRKITSPLLCQLCFNFLLYHTSKIQPLASNLKLISKIWYECIRTFEYFPIWIFVCIIFVSFFWYEYIRVFVRIAFLIRIYSDIRSYHFLDIIIFKYSFVSNNFICHTPMWTLKSISQKGDHETSWGEIRQDRHTGFALLPWTQYNVFSVLVVC